MQKAFLGKTKFNYPTAAEEVTVGAYLRSIEAVRKFNPDGKFHLQIDTIVDIVSKFYDVDRAVIKKTAVGGVSKMLANALDLIGKANSTKPKSSFTFKGEVYSVGSIDPGTKQMEFGEYGDAVTALNHLDSLMPEFAEKYGKEAYIPLMVALIAKKGKEEYNPLERAKEFLELPLVDALGVCFFLNKQHEYYSNVTLDYSGVVKPEGWGLRVMFTYLRNWVYSISRTALRWKR